MTLVILIRHAHSTANGSGILAGRTEGVQLSPAGKKQASQLAGRLGEIPIKSLLSSPLERCESTISPWLKKVSSTFPNLRIEMEDDLSEVDYGEWTGRKLQLLSKEKLWRQIQDRPSRVTFPKGESLAAMQKRAMRAVEYGLGRRGRGHVMIVSHGDVIKSIIAASLNLHLDEFQRLVVDPASITILDFSSTKPRLILMNDSRSRLNPEMFHNRKKRLLVGGGAGIANTRKSK